MWDWHKWVCHMTERALPQGSLASRSHPAPPPPAEQESGAPSSHSYPPISAFLIGSEPLACD